jgi:hypothetical protein
VGLGVYRFAKVDDDIVSSCVLIPYWPPVIGKDAAGNILIVLALKMNIVFATGYEVM